MAREMQRAGLDTDSCGHRARLELHQPRIANCSFSRVSFHAAAALLILADASSPVYAQDSSPALKITVGAFAVAQAADTNLTTWLLAQSGDRYREANPLVRPFAHQPVTLALVKSAAATGVSYALLRLGKSERKRTRVAALVTGIGLTAASTWVSYSNYQHYRREVAR